MIEDRKIGGQKMLKKTILVIALFLMVVNQGTATVVNETVDNFRISFDGGYDINMIARAWDLHPSDFPSIDNVSVAKMHGIAALNINNFSDFESNDGALVLILIFSEPVNVTNAEKNFSESSKPYMRVYDRTIDGHNGLYVLEGDGPNDPDISRVGSYWLNEDNKGMATELVMIMCLTSKTESDAKILNTVHVEKNKAPK